MKILIIVMINLFTFHLLNAQKLPNKQQGSLRVPALIKIDGNATEWGNTFKAYNKATDIFYTLANDDENIYLLVKAPYRYAVDKILLGGITLTVCAVGNEKSSENFTLTFPTLSRENRIAMTAITIAYQDIKDDTLAKLKQHDSIVNLANYKAVNTFKLVKIKGVNQTDSLILAYNENGLKAMAKFARNMDLVCEFTFPLRYAGLTVSKTGKLSYHIKLNGPPPVKMFDKFGNETTGIDQKSVYVPGNGNINADALSRSLPTDFWGEYTLAKK